MGVVNFREQNIPLGALRTSERAGTLPPSRRGQGGAVSPSIHVRGIGFAELHHPEDQLRLPKVTTDSGSLAVTPPFGVPATLTDGDRESSNIRRLHVSQADEPGRGGGRGREASAVHVPGAQGAAGSDIGAEVVDAGRRGPPRKPPRDSGHGVSDEQGDEPQEQPDRGKSMQEVVPIPTGELGAVVRLQWVTEQDIKRFARRIHRGDAGKFTGPLFGIPEIYDPSKHERFEGITRRYQFWLSGRLTARRIQREEAVWVGKHVGETTQTAISFDSLATAVTSGTIQKIDGIGPKALPLLSAFVEDRRNQIALRSEIAWARNDVNQSKGEVQREERREELPPLMRRILQGSIRGEDAERRYYEAGFGDGTALDSPSTTHATIFLKGIYGEEPRITALNPSQRRELSVRLVQSYVTLSRIRQERRAHNAAIAMRYIEGGTLEEIQNELGNGDNVDSIGHIAEWLLREYGVGQLSAGSQILENILEQYIP